MPSDVVEPRQWGCACELLTKYGHAACDFRELRDLLGAWCIARTAAWQTVILVSTTALLFVIVVGVAIKFKLLGGNQ